jgi:hypothetical protein
MNQPPFLVDTWQRMSWINFTNFISLKNHKIRNNLTTAETREKISADLEL